MPVTSGAAADVVIGQPNFTSNTLNNGGRSAATMNSPRGILVVNSKLLVADAINHRVLIWNSIPVSNGASADLVIGQINMTNGTANQGGNPATNTLNVPGGMGYENGRLYIVDGSNHRLLIYNNGIPTSNNVSADIVIGQPNFSSNSANQGGSSPGQNTLRGPNVLQVSGNKLFVSEFNNNRILIYTNIITTPTFGLNGTPAGSTDSKLKLSGNVTVSGGAHKIWKVEASVNGGGYTSVTTLGENLQNGKTHDPNSTQPVTTSFSHDFEPWIWPGHSEGNGTKSDWTNKQTEMLKDRGYTLKLRAYNTNADLAEHMFYFQPFSLNTPKLSTSCHSRESGNPDASSTGSPVKPGMTKAEARMTTECFPTLPLTPVLTFSVNQYQRTEMKENLEHYEVWVRKSQNSNLKAQNEKDASSDVDNAWGDWKRYITKIPIDYDTVKEYQDNQRRGDYVDNPGSGNGTYENNDISVSYSKSSSILSVRKKNSNQDGTTINSLTPGIYEFKIKAIDKHNHDQDSDPVTVEVKGLSTNKNNLTITTDWFPLQINSISGAQTGILSTNNPYGIKDNYSISTVTPAIKGIAFSNTRVTLLVSDTFSDQTRTYETTTKADSTFTFTLTLYQNSLISLSVEDTSGKYNELPVFGLNMTQSNNEEVQGVQTEKTTRSISNPSTSLREENVLPTPRPNESPLPQTSPSQKCFLWWCF